MLAQLLCLSMVHGISNFAVVNGQTKMLFTLTSAAHTEGHAVVFSRPTDRKHLRRRINHPLDIPAVSVA